MEPLTGRLDCEGARILREERNATIINTYTAGTAGRHAPGDRARPEPSDAILSTGTTVVGEGRIDAL
ncbi:hypothetical protein GF325_02330 [Candidatus Bathyarchaeota archaeon]|nr:hypothetical protein [Candidatus Bathyarchaeota archaeon]